MPIRFRFKPQLFPSLATVLLIPLFIHLGLWQAGKAERKTALQATLDQRMREAPQAFSVAMGEMENPRYLRVRVRGHYDAAHVFLLDNQIQQGRAGFHVITPLRLENQAGMLLINRGWVPFSGDRTRLPKIETPPGEVEITGHLVPPPVSTVAAKYLPAPGSWSLIWPSLDLPRLNEVLGHLHPVLVRMDPDSAGWGYLRAWERPDERIAMHRSYTLQWFLLAGALGLAWLVLSFRRLGTIGETP